MSKNMVINDYMTRPVHGITPDETLDVAARRMRDNDIRHLPVRNGGKVVGLITQRDVDIAKAVTKSTLGHTLVSDVMVQEPYCVESNANLRSVVREMAERKFSSAIIVTKEGNVEGIFTEIDALRVFGRQLMD
jgi:acetoin utilization protein AcuB